MSRPPLRSAVVALVISIVACSSSDPGADPGPAPALEDGGQSSGNPPPATTPPGGGCTTDAECTTDFCDNAKCVAPTAGSNADGRRNAGETDVDCGGASGKLCAVGKKCKVVGDCETTCVAGVCAPPGDTDGKKNNGETDVDCGGPNAKKCGVGKVCATGDDCGLGYCPALKCVAPTSSDTVKNGLETDVDCGGAAETYDGVTVPAAPKCAVAKSCAADTDCESTVCSASKHCVEAPSCRPIHGGETCGTGEFGVAGAVHESCCKSLAVPGLTVVQGGVTKQVYLDKYEITAGRIREWIKSIKAAYGGVPNIQAWVKARMATDPILAAQFPTDKADYLPSQLSGQTKVITDPDATGDFDMGLLAQLGPTSYVRGVLANGGTSGCAMYPDSYGHRTYWFDATEAAYFFEIARPAAQKDWLDEKSMNCITPLMFTAFCAWDGGYMQSQAAISNAYGPSQWPWGDTPTPTDNVAKMSNYNSGTGGFNGVTKSPRYLYPNVNYATFANDFSPIIAAPGRFPTDGSQVLPIADTWMDLGGNMIEWSQVSGTWRGWTGASFEGHLYPRAWTGGINYLDKYGKGGSRCMRLKDL